MVTLNNAWYLVAAPALLAALTLFSRNSARPLPRWRRRASLAARAAVVTLLALALAGPAISTKTERPFLTVFAVDLSESVPDRALDPLLRGLKNTWDREVAQGNSCALVAFAGRSEVLIPPGTAPFPEDGANLFPRAALRGIRIASEKGESASPPGRIYELQKRIERLAPRSTDLAGAIRTARGLFQDGASNRIVLVTDGRDTTESPPMIDLGEEDWTFRVIDPSRRDIALERIEAPLAVREGEPFDVRAVVTTTLAGPFSLSLTIDDVAIPEARRSFTADGPGRHAAILENVRGRTSMTPGLHVLQVMVDAPGDEEPRNNMAAAVLNVAGKPRVLLVEGSPAEASPLSRLMKAQDIDFSLEPAARLRSLCEALDEYVAVILAGVPVGHVDGSIVTALSRYVEGSGGGLWIVGSPALRGNQGYAGSGLEKLLPVTFLDTPVGAGADEGKPGPPSPPAPNPADPPQKVLAPTVALLFIVDKSGSMAGDNISLVKEACIASAKTLSPKDVVGVLAFDVQPKWVLEFTEADRHQYVEEKVLRLLADGGTSIQPALEEALRAFRTDPRARRAGVKHAILLSDGDTRPGDFETPTRRLAEEGVTVTTVCVPGPKTEQHLMYQIAAWGKGRFKFAPGFDHVPQIFTNETRQVLGAATRGIPASPALPPGPAAPADPGPGPSSLLPVKAREDHEILQGIERASLPPIRGLLGAAARAGASVPLTAGKDQPLLCLWRMGLGKTAVWTSDLSGRWSPEWPAWPPAGKLFAQLIRHLASAAPDSDLASRVTLSKMGNRAIVRVDPGPPGEGLTVSDPATRTETPLAPSEDGGFRLEIPLARAGEMKKVLLKRADGKSLWIGALRPFEEEYAPAPPERPPFLPRLHPGPWTDLEKSLLAPRKSAEGKRDLAPWLIVLAALLLPLDTGLRRINA